MELFAEIKFKSHYDNFIGGHFLPPIEGNYFDAISPINGKPYSKAALSTLADIDVALDAAHSAFLSWKNTSVVERSNILLKIADRIESNAELLAAIETINNGKPIRECLLNDIPLAVDHFRYFAGVIRGQEGTISEIDESTISICINEPIGVVAQIIPWNFPILMAAWKIAPALAAGNCTIVKPARNTPVSIIVMMEMIQDLLPPGVVNVVNGKGTEIGEALAKSDRIAKISFTGETTTGRKILGCAAENIIPSTMELGGKSPMIFFSSIMAKDDDFLDKAVEGAVLFALNQGEVCSAPTRMLVQEDIYSEFMARVIARTKAIKMLHPLDRDCMLGAQSSKEQLDKIRQYIQIGIDEGAEVLTGGCDWEASTKCHGSGDGASPVEEQSSSSSLQLHHHHHHQHHHQQLQQEGGCGCDWEASAKCHGSGDGASRSSSASSPVEEQSSSSLQLHQHHHHQQHHQHHYQKLQQEEGREGGYYITPTIQRTQ